MTLWGRWIWNFDYKQSAAAIQLLSWCLGTRKICGAAHAHCRVPSCVPIKLELMRRVNIYEPEIKANQSLGISLVSLCSTVWWALICMRMPLHHHKSIIIFFLLWWKCPISSLCMCLLYCIASRIVKVTGRTMLLCPQHPINVTVLQPCQPLLAAPPHHKLLLAHLNLPSLLLIY
jgi:hypothetical protein